MPEVEKSDIMSQTLKAIITVARRRTLDSHIVKILDNVISKLEKQYIFLKEITIKDAVYSEDGEIVKVSSNINDIDSKILGSAIEEIIRRVCAELDEDALLYFITEIRETIGEKYVLEVEKLGVDLKSIEKEHHELFNQQNREETPEEEEKNVEVKEEIKEKEVDRFLEYNWDDVSKWEYDNNVCLLYKGDGSLLDTLHLDDLVEDYITRYTKYIEPETPTSTMLDITNKDISFLETLYTRDMDMDFASGILDISKDELESIVNKLLDLKMLERISDFEVKLTQKGILLLMEKIEGN